MTVVQMMYTGLFVLSFALYAILLMVYKKRISLWYVLMFGCALINNFGYMQMISSDGLRTALFANQVAYLGSCFCPFFLMMCIADLCKVNVTKICQALFMLYGVCIFSMISMIGTFDWYYKDVEFNDANGYGMLIKEYGPLHILFPIYLFLVMGVAIYMVVKSFKRRADVSYKNSVMMLAVLVMSTLVYVLEKMLGVDIELLPIAYIAAEIVILLLLRRISLFDVTAISTDSMVQSTEYGFLMFDEKGRYLGADRAAKIWFPETLNWQIDSVVKVEESSELYEHILEWLGEDECEHEKEYIHSGDKIIEARHDTLREGKKSKLNMIYLRDETQAYEYTKLVEKFNEKLEKDVKAKTEKLRRVQNDIIISMASIVENRDNNTGGHIARTSDVVRIFIEYLQKNCKEHNISEHLAESIIKAAPLHDFGKTAIPDRILNKPGKFEPDEYEIMKEHAAKGAVIVEKILRNVEDKKFKKIAINVAHYHHEKWDGTGYPSGLKAEEIPFEARVMALADVFDALVSKRVYKDSFSYEKAFSIIEESCGTHFDPHLCKDFLKCREKFIQLYDSYED